MKYALLIYDKPGAHEALGAQELEAVCVEYAAQQRFALRWRRPAAAGAHGDDGSR